MSWGEKHMASVALDGDSTVTLFQFLWLEVSSAIWEVVL